MLELISSFGQLDITQLLRVYSQENRKNGRRFFPNLDADNQLYRAEDNFISYIREDFFCNRGAIYALWIVNGRYEAALRFEPYKDGLLLEALETAPESRRKGYGGCLINAILNHLKTTECKILYSHVHKNNTPSISLHKKCGFHIFSDCAEYIDGTVTQSSFTFCYRFQ